MLITGAGGGIGAAIAQRALASGYDVGVLYAAPEVHTGTDRSNVVYLSADVTDAVAVEAALEQFGAVDVVVNNAGILRTGPLLEHSPDDFRRVMDVNLTGAFIVAQAAARRMLATGGVILNMSSINGIHPSPNCGAYVAAKAGLMALTQQMSIEWGQYGIRVNAIAPGFIDAGMSTPFYQDPAVRARRANAVPLGRLGTARDVAETVLFLASDAAAYISGQTITVDGGVINSVLQQLPRE
jgi:NAD(P)-dependent dehydrogenase (short-subunit alcohol dehydrogenase family)